MSLQGIGGALSNAGGAIQRWALGPGTIYLGNASAQALENLWNLVLGGDTLAIKLWESIIGGAGVAATELIPMPDPLRNFLRTLTSFMVFKALDAWTGADGAAMANKIRSLASYGDPLAALRQILKIPAPAAGFAWPAWPALPGGFALPVIPGLPTLAQIEQTLKSTFAWPPRIPAVGFTWPAPPGANAATAPSMQAQSSTLPTTFPRSMGVWGNYSLPTPQARVNYSPGGRVFYQASAGH